MMPPIMNIYPSFSKVSPSYAAGMPLLSAGSSWLSIISGYPTEGNAGLAEVRQII